MSLPESEFVSLRQTIAMRGSIRMALLPVVIIGWAALNLTLLLVTDFPAGALFTLAVLVAGFEAIHALHVGAERIGRFLQVYYETASDETGVHASDSPRWETTAMAVGPALPGGGIDPLFTVVFVVTTLVNLIPVLAPQPTRPELAVIALGHLAFVVRVVRARGAAARQRAVELESFRAIHAKTNGSPRSQNPNS